MQRDEYNKRIQIQQDTQINRWLKQRNKQMFIQFNQSKINKLEKYFKDLLTNEKNYLENKELYRCLLYMQVSDQVSHLKNLIDLIDVNNSGSIEYSEFIHLIKGKTNVYNFNKNKQQQLLKSKFIELLNDDTYKDMNFVSIILYKK